MVDDGSRTPRRRCSSASSARDAAGCASTPPDQPRQERRRAQRDRESRGDIVLIQDADLEYDPPDIPRAGRPDPRRPAPTSCTAPACAAASRSAPTCSGTTWATASSRCSRTCSTTPRSRDMEVGYKAFNGDLIRSLPLVSDDFRLRARGHREAPAPRRTSACTRSRSPTTAAPTRRARRSRGATASAPSPRCCASGSLASAARPRSPRGSTSFGSIETTSWPSPQSIRSTARRPRRCGRRRSRPRSRSSSWVPEIVSLPAPPST